MLGRRRWQKGERGRVHGGKKQSRKKKKKKKSFGWLPRRDHSERRRRRPLTTDPGAGVHAQVVVLGDDSSCRSGRRGLGRATPRAGLLPAASEATTAAAAAAAAGAAPAAPPWALGSLSGRHSSSSSPGQAAPYASNDFKKRDRITKPSGGEQSLRLAAVSFFVATAPKALRTSSKRASLNRPAFFPLLLAFFLTYSSRVDTFRTRRALSSRKDRTLALRLSSVCDLRRRHRFGAPFFFEENTHAATSSSSSVSPLLP